MRKGYEYHTRKCKGCGGSFRSKSKFAKYCYDCILKHARFRYPLNAKEQLNETTQQ